MRQPDSVKVPVEPTEEMVESMCAAHTLAKWPDDFGITAQSIRRNKVVDMALRTQAAEAEREEMRKDAERYRWLRKASSSGRQTRAQEILLARYYPEGDIDAAIDSAIRALAQPKDYPGPEEER